MRATFAAILLLAPLAGALPLDGQDDAGSGGDAGDTMPFAVPIPRGVRLTGDAVPFLDTDLYVFDATAGETLRITLEGSGCASLETPEGESVAQACDTHVGGWTDVVAPATGPLALRVFTEAATTYTFGVDAPLQRTPAHDDAGTGFDASDSRHLAQDVPRGVDIAGDVDVYDRDVYTFQAVAGEPLAIAMAGVDACLDVLETDFTLCTTAGEVVDLWTAPATATYTLEVSGLLRQRYSFGLDTRTPPGDVQLGVLGPIHPARGQDPTCGLSSPVIATSGATESGLVFAALKTGFRAVVAWSTPEPTIANLTYSLDGGESATVSEATPRTQHAFVLDGLPTGASLCFTAPGHAPHAVRLANAWNAQEADGSYTTNLLVVANTQVTQRAVLEGSLPLFGGILRDMTDGHLRAGRVVVLYGDAERERSLYTCLSSSCTVPACDQAADVYYTYGACPNGAACANLLGIDDPYSHIWMSSVWQANAVLSIDDEASVLAHEMGHYLFGADDQYTSQTVSTGEDLDCYDPALDLSVMSATRGTTELDDAIHRCPNEPLMTGGYLPSWESLRSAFPSVPARASIDEGPHGAGDAFALHVFATTPGVEMPQPSDVPQDDAGSGRDAPDAPDPAFRVEPRVVYEGLATPLADTDLYAFDGRAGDRVHLAVTGPICAMITHADGADAESDCQSQEVTNVRAVLPSDGPWYLRFYDRGEYRFSFALNGAASVPLL